VEHKKLRNISFVFSFTVLGLFLASSFFVRMVFIGAGECMAPLINPHDIVLIVPSSKFSRGDIVAAEVSPSKVFVKRILGIPGDAIDKGDHQVIVNGTRHIIEVEKARAHGIIPPDLPDKIPPGYLYLAGDNNTRSLDSRYIGLVPSDRVIGKAVLIIPTGRWL